MNNAYLLFGGIPIKANSDLNDVMSIGNYHCASNDSASTIINRPFAMNSAFTLKVCSGTGQSFNYLRQELTVYSTGTKYIRTNIYGNREHWSEWDREVLTRDLVIIDSGRTCFPPADIGIQTVSVAFNKKFTKDVRVIVSFCDTLHVYNYCEYVSVQSQNLYGFVAQTKRLINTYNWYFNWIAIGR